MKKVFHNWITPLCVFNVGKYRSKSLFRIIFNTKNFKSICQKALIDTIFKQYCFELKIIQNCV
jgi:hypothetical protein